MSENFFSCNWLEHGIIFDHGNKIKVCCSRCNEGGGHPVLMDNYCGELIDWTKLFSLKREMRNIQRKGDIFHRCKGCISLEKSTWDDDDYIDKLLLTHWIECNCRCIYCPAVSDVELKKNNNHYNIVPVLQDMCDKNILKKNALISIAGGESTIYPEFEDLLNLLLDYGCNNIVLNSSGIKYSPAVSRGLAVGNLLLTISVDSGRKETYEALKLVKKYDLLYENLEKYVNAQGVGNNQVCSKFIIVPGYNDSGLEIELWLQNTVNTGIKKVSVDVDWRWVQENLSTLKQERKIYELIVFADKIAKKENLILKYHENASIIRQIHKPKTALFGGNIQKIKG